MRHRMTSPMTPPSVLCTTRRTAPTTAVAAVVVTVFAIAASAVCVDAGATTVIADAASTTTIGSFAVRVDNGRQILTVGKRGADQDLHESEPARTIFHTFKK